MTNEQDAPPVPKPPGAATNSTRGQNADAQEAERFPAFPDRTDPEKRQAA